MEKPKRKVNINRYFCVNGLKYIILYTYLYLYISYIHLIFIYSLYFIKYFKNYNITKLYLLTKLTYLMIL